MNAPPAALFIAWLTTKFTGSLSKLYLKKRLTSEVAKSAILFISFPRVI